MINLMIMVVGIFAYAIVANLLAIPYVLTSWGAETPVMFVISLPMAALALWTLVAADDDVRITLRPLCRGIVAWLVFPLMMSLLAVVLGRGGLAAEAAFVQAYRFVPLLIVPPLAFVVWCYGMLTATMSRRHA